MHNHSTASDGLLSPSQLVELGARHGVHAIALTDHDTVDGLEEAAAAARKCGVRLVEGVEISVSWGETTVHVVGLGIDPADASLAGGLQSVRDGRLGRATRMADSSRTWGHPGHLEAALALAGSEQRLSRTHFARHLAESGAVRNTQHAFDKYLGKGKPAFVHHRWAGLEDAVGWIVGAGGVAVLAHPGRYGLKPLGRATLLEEFKRLGGEAIEVVTGSHRPEEYATWRRVAEEYGFLASRGSDFHGPGESPVEPGGAGPLCP
ncbi:MAG: PHP domain-containing protein [Betaproteobacteria bacterium]|nr:PHP domain-containing protein [Betaproteobacteria bacterium]